MSSSSPSTRTLRLVCTSDTHNEFPSPVPDGDILIHAGDMTNTGTLPELTAVYTWLTSLPHPIKLIVPGNHDANLDASYRGTAKGEYPQTPADHERALALFSQDPSIHLFPSPGCTKAITIPAPEMNLTVYGNPAVPWPPGLLGGPFPFNYAPHPSPEAERAWGSAPGEGAAEVWITHTPPQGRLDYNEHGLGLEGCEVLAEKVEKARPRLCVFGHLHMSHGAERVMWETDEVERMEVGEGKVVEVGGVEKKGRETVFVNAAWMTEGERKVPERNRPFVVDIEVPVVAR